MGRLGEVVTLSSRVIDTAYDARVARAYTGRRASLLADRLGRVEEANRAGRFPTRIEIGIALHHVSAIEHPQRAAVTRAHAVLAHVRAAALEAGVEEAAEEFGVARERSSVVADRRGRSQPMDLCPQGRKPLPGHAVGHLHS